MKTISAFLKQSRNQKMVYVAGIVGLMLMHIDDFQYISKISFFSGFLWSFTIPLILLSLQLWQNSKVIWTIIVAYLGLYSLWIIWNIIELDILIDLQRDYSPRPFWTLEKVFNWIVILSVLLVVNWFVWKIKPNPSEKH